MIGIGKQNSITGIEQQKPVSATGAGMAQGAGNAQAIKEQQENVKRLFGGGMGMGGMGMGMGGMGMGGMKPLTPEQIKANQDAYNKMLAEEKAKVDRKDNLLKGMVADRVTPEQRRSLAEGLANFDEKLLGRLKKNGVKLDVGSKEEFDKRDADFNKGQYAGYKKDLKADGYYLNEKKVALIHQDKLKGQTAAHELGHAVDDLAAPDVKAPKSGQGINGSDTLVKFKSDEDPQVQKLYTDYMKRTENYKPGDMKSMKNVWSEYARTNKREYIAEGTAMYEQNQSSQQLLKQEDPGLYQYLKGQLK
jgi:hypothetical protein